MQFLIFAIRKLIDNIEQEQINKGAFCAFHTFLKIGISLYLFESIQPKFLKSLEKYIVVILILSQKYRINKLLFDPTDIELLIVIEFIGENR